MNKINYGKAYTHRITIRLNDEQYEFIAKMCGIIDATPSDYIRMSINSALFAFNKQSMSDMLATGETVPEMLDKASDKVAKKPAKDAPKKSNVRRTKAVKADADK